jgi:anti-anti-sigma regulatory factor
MSVGHHRTGFGATLDSRYGNSEIVCRGVRLTAYARSLATVIAISGDIDAGNADFVRENATRFLLVDKAVILDLSGVTCFGMPGVGFLFAFDDECAKAGVEWALVASPEISMTLAATDEDTLPTVSSVAQALQRFSNPARRRALLELVTRAARTRVNSTPTDS